MSFVAKCAHAAPRNTTTYTACTASPRSMSRHSTGSRKKSIQASQYRVGMYGATTFAELIVTSTWLVISAASAPSAAASGESVTVDRNSAIAPTPSIDTAMNATAPRIRSVRPAGVTGDPDSDVAAAAAAEALGAARLPPPTGAATGADPNSEIPVT